MFKDPAQGHNYNRSCNVPLTQVMFFPANRPVHFPNIFPALFRAAGHEVGVSGFLGQRTLAWRVPSSPSQVFRNCAFRWIIKEAYCSHKLFKLFSLLNINHYRFSTSVRFVESSSFPPPTHNPRLCSSNAETRASIFRSIRPWRIFTTCGGGLLLLVY